MKSLIWKIVFIVIGAILIASFFIKSANAQQGCCSWHGGVCGCSSSGKKTCCDGTLSPSCLCSTGTTGHLYSNCNTCCPVCSICPACPPDLQTNVDNLNNQLKDAQATITNQKTEIDKLKDSNKVCGSKTTKGISGWYTLLISIIFGLIMGFIGYKIGIKKGIR